jgi:hypothetical protein
MKKIAVLVFTMLIISAGLIAQDVWKKNAVKADLFSVILRTGTIKYERAFTEDISVQLGFFYTGYHPRDSQSELSGWGITPEFRFYLTDTPAPAGTYLAPNFRYMKLDVYDAEAMESGILKSLGFAINLGKQWVFKDVVLLDAWVGPVYAFRTVEGDVSTGVEDADGFGLRIGLALGIVF